MISLFSMLPRLKTAAWKRLPELCANSSKLSDSMNLRRCLCLSSSRLPSRPFGSRELSLLLPAALLLAVSVPALAQGTRLWTQSRFDEFEKGTPQGVQITSDGKLRNGPMATEIVTTPSSFVWSVAVGKDGGAYLGTGSPATVLRVNPDKTADPRFTKLFETKAVAVQVVRVGPDGALYAATIPDGKVYRIKTEAAKTQDETTAEVVFDLSKAASNGVDEAKSADGNKTDGKARYIWDMTFDTAGRLYIATGGPGAVYRIDVSKPKPAAEAFFKTDEQHIRSLAWDRAGKDGAGNLIAGTDGSGLVYRISPEGKGYVLFSAPRREITAVAVDADGTIYAADVGDKNHNPLPQLPVQSGGVGITISFVQPGSMQAANASTVLPEGSEIYALKPDQAPRKAWSDKDAIVYQMAATANGLTVLTGNRGRIFTLRPDGGYSDVAHLEAQQAVAMGTIPEAQAAGGLLVGTANTGKLYLLSAEDAGMTAAASAHRYAAYIHNYASDVLDAGAMSRWGRVELEPGSRGYEIWTRSGNVEQPARSDKDWGWSDWQQAAGDKIASPPGRYLQWKAALTEGGVVSGVGVNYLPVNSAPVVDDLLVVPGARFSPQPQAAGQPGTVTIAFPNPTANAGVSFDGNTANATQPIQAQKDRTAVTVRWAAHDDDGDDLIFDLYLRGDGETVWRPLKKGLTDKVYSFDGAAFPDGGYQVKVVASDAPSHTPGSVLSGGMESVRFELDTTAPVISGLKADGPVSRKCKELPCPPAFPVSFDAKDAATAISHAEYSLDAGPWQYIEPAGGLSDSKEEHYSFLVPMAASTESAPGAGSNVEHLITVRAYDRHDNMGTAKVLVPASGPTSSPVSNKAEAK
jgi:hypothetical protein